jgi:hypothetical protein
MMNSSPQLKFGLYGAIGQRERTMAEPWPEVPPERLAPWPAKSLLHQENRTRCVVFDTDDDLKKMKSCFSIEV